MNLQELRIGNYYYLIDRKSEVHIPIEIPFQAYAIEPFSVWGCCADKSFAQTPVEDFVLTKAADVAPIPISEEWLKRLGFVDGKLGSLRLLRINSDYYLAYINQSKSLDVDIKWVHQLQNLYFALTGDELTLKHLTTPC